MFSKNAHLFFFIIKLSQIYSLIIPLYSIKNLSHSNSILDYLDSFKNDMKYSYINIGEPPQKFQIFFKSTESINNIKGEDCFSDSFYNLNISNTKKYSFEQNIKNYLYVNDIISFDNDYQKILMSFIYYTSAINKNSNCGNIGFGYTLPNEEEHNLFFQLKKSKIINKTIFYFNYTTNDDLSINIGIEPFEINNSYSMNFTRIGIESTLDYEKKPGKLRKYDWNINISKIFYFRKVPLKTNIDPYNEISRIKTRRVKYFQAFLTPEEELIKAPYEYQESIENNFFDDLISDNICQKRKFENKYYFYCKKEYKNLIKNTFPSLYFYQEELNYMFELNYDDLFIEKNEYLFFGIYFDCFVIEVFKGAFISEWYFGKIFLKKYLFGFDFEKHELIFYKAIKAKTKYKNKDETKNPEEKGDNNKKIYDLGLILIFITIGVFAFILERIVRKKYRTNSLLIDYNNRQI